MVRFGCSCTRSVDVVRHVHINSKGSKPGRRDQLRPNVSLNVAQACSVFSMLIQAARYDVVALMSLRCSWDTLSAWKTTGT